MANNGILSKLKEACLLERAIVGFRQRNHDNDAPKFRFSNPPICHLVEHETVEADTLWADRRDILKLNGTFKQALLESSTIA
jgi:hypothetical protein